MSRNLFYIIFLTALISSCGDSKEAEKQFTREEILQIYLEAGIDTSEVQIYKEGEYDNTNAAKFETKEEFKAWLIEQKAVFDETVEEGKVIKEAALKKKRINDNAFYLCTDGCATIKYKKPSGQSYYLHVCIEGGKFKKGNSYISGFTLAISYEHKNAWMVKKTNQGYYVKAEGILKYDAGIPGWGGFWTKKVTLSSVDFDPCTSTGLLFVTEES